MLLAAGIAAVSAWWLTNHPLRVWIATVIAAGLVIANVLLWRVNARSGIMAAFGSMALASATLGIGWTLGMIGP
ncbi:MAG: hypothetical protein R2845_04775 [Thermomicrobiales bacterium]